MEKINHIAGVEFGGPTIFLQAPSGLWGQFQLPEGVRIEDGATKLNIFDCVFLGVLYREVKAPKRPTPDLSQAVVESLAKAVGMESDELQTWRAASREWNVILSRDDLEVTFCKEGFVTLLPIDAVDSNGKPVTYGL